MYLIRTKQRLLQVKYKRVNYIKFLRVMRWEHDNLTGLIVRLGNVKFTYNKQKGL